MRELIELVFGVVFLTVAVIGIPMAVFLSLLGICFVQYDRVRHAPPKGRIGALIENFAACGAFTMVLMAIVGIIPILMYCV